MRILVVGSTGTIGAAVAGELDAQGHIVLGASRKNARFAIDISDDGSICALFEALRAVDALVCAAGCGVHFTHSDKGEGVVEALDGQRFGQLSLVRHALEHVKQSIVLTSGVVSFESGRNEAPIARSNGLLERYVRETSADFDSPRINVVSPPLIHETTRSLGCEEGVPAARVARLYRDAIEGDASGEVFCVG